jgi:3-oxo-5alpha-steroid 4-dehydrogenase
MAFTPQRGVTPVPAAGVKTYDLEADVVVVGYGCAGASAALSASTAGSDVLLLERAGGGGGASAMAGGLIYLGGGTALQKACGFEDSPEEMYKFLVAATGPDPDETKIATYCEGSVEHFDWLVECGVPFKESFYDGLLAEPPGDDGLMYSGGEDAYPWNEIARPAPRAHVPAVEGKVLYEKAGGWQLMRSLTAAVANSPVRVETDIRVDRLITESDGTISGVVSRRYGETLHIRARSGVILAGGGFVFNDEMLGLHAPKLVGRLKVGTDGDDGQCIQMAQSLGAAVRHMDAAEVAYCSQSPMLVRSIVTNVQGQRYVNEDGYFGRVGQTTLFSQGGRSFLVFDEEVFESVPEDQRPGLQPTWVCATVAELEESMGVPDGALQSTVEVYNRFAEKGEDPLFHKRAQYLKPLCSPYAAIDFREAILGVFTIGGLRTDIDGRVLNLEGDAIPGLFAVGRSSSGIPNWGYLSGASLGDGTFFGRRAGEAVAKAG